MNEESWVITGTRFGGLWVGWCRWRTEGQPATVEFSWKKVWRRHRFQRDVLGFRHTHPKMPAIPSHIDIATMRALVASLGRPLLCVIDGSDGIRGYIFPDDESEPIELMKVYSLGWGITVGVEYGRSIYSRSGVPGRSCA